MQTKIKMQAQIHDAVIKKHFTLARHDQLRRYALRRNLQLIGSCFTQEKVQNWVTMNFIMGAQIALQIYDILNSRREATKSHSKVWDHHKKLSRKQQKPKPVHPGAVLWPFFEVMGLNERFTFLEHVIADLP